MGLVSRDSSRADLAPLWAVFFALSIPIRQAFLNGIIPSAQRATVLSSDNLLNLVGRSDRAAGLGMVADLWGWPGS